MKFIKIASLCAIVLFAFSCVKGLDYTYDETKVVELEDAVRRTPSAGVKYPLIAVTRTAGVQSLQVNLVGKQLLTDQEMTFSVDTAIAFQLTNSANIRAVEGTHFKLNNGGKFIMSKDSSFARMNVEILNPGANTGKFAVVMLRLDGSAEIKPSENYRRVAFRIALN